MRKLRGTVVIAASAALIAAGVLASAGSAGTSGIGAGNLAFAGDDIAFYSDRKGNNDVYVLHLNTNSVEQLTTWASSETEPSYAPDGPALVFVSTISGATELWVQNLAGLSPTTSKPIRITSDKRFKSHPSWGRAVSAPLPSAS